MPCGVKTKRAEPWLSKTITDKVMSSDVTPSGARIHWPALVVAIALMLVGSVAPIYLSDVNGKADHVQALFWFWCMSAGFVRGVGFVPRHVIWRWTFSAWACFAALAVAVAWRVQGW